MYNISNTATKAAVEAALAAQTRVFEQRISFGTLSADGVFTAQKTITEGIISLHISQQANGNGSGLTMGCCCAACADVEFYNPDKTFVYEGKTLFVECGIQLEDGSFYYIPLGYYKTEKPESDDDYYTVKVKCYDAVNAMTGKWQSSLSFPSATAYDILFEAASKYGVGIVISSSIMRTKLRDRYVTAEEAAILEQYTDREVIGILAGLVGCNARINTVGKLAIGWYSGAVSVPPELQWQNGFKKTQESPFTISSVTSGSDDKVFTAGTGSGLSFANPIITEDEITTIYDEISGYEFQPCECEWRGNPCVEAGDRAVVTDRKGKTYSVYIAAQELDLTGGLSSVVSCPAGDAEVSFDTVDERTRSALNKQRTTLQEAIIAASNAINGALGGYLKIGDSDGDGNPDYMLITENANGEAVSGSATNGYIMFNKAGIGLSTDGGQTYRTAITFGGINADCITTGKLSADLIDTSQLIISKGNVEGLDAELDAITNSVDTANTNASNAQTTASSAKTAANNANTTASAAQTTANRVNTVIGQWCYNNDTTYINGGKIATGTIEANAIAANSITTDRLVVGNGLRSNMFFNDEFEDGTKGWWGYNCTLTGQGSYGSKYITVSPTSSSGVVIAFQKVWMERGKRYRFSAQIAPLAWNYSADSANFGAWTGGVGESGKEQAMFSSDAFNNNGEVIISLSFYNNRDTGWGDVGFYYSGAYSGSSSKLCSVNVAWMCLTEEDDTSLGTTTHFWCSKKEWLSSSYRASNLIPFSSTSENYRTARALTVDGAGNLTTLGFIDSREGRLGSVRYTDNEFRALSHTYDTSTNYAYSSSLLIGTPSSVLNISSSDIVEVGRDIAPYILLSSYSTSGGSSSSNETDTALFTINGMRISSGSYSSTVRYNGIETTGDLSCKGITATGVISASGNITTSQSVSANGVSARTVSASSVITAPYVSTSSVRASGFQHTRTDADAAGGNTVKLIAGKNVTQWSGHSNSIKNTAALELSTDGTVYARLDVGASWGSAVGAITTYNGSSRSAPLELGTESMWFNGNLMTSSSSEKYKTDIQPYTDSALSLVKSSVIYSYKYKSDGENALTKYGLVIERECPQEVVDNSGDAISLYSMCSILWKSVQELNAKVEALGGENNA